MSQLVLKRASASRPSGKWGENDYDVLADGVVVGRILKARAAPVGVDAHVRVPRGPHADDWLRANARGRDGSVRQELAAGIGPPCHWRSRRRDEEALLSESHHETCEVDCERAESTERCKTSHPALWSAERKQVARLNLRAVPIQLAGGFLDPKEGQSLLGNGSNTLRPIVGMFVRDLVGAVMLPIDHLIALSVRALHPRG